MNDTMIDKEFDDALTNAGLMGWQPNDGDTTAHSICVLFDGVVEEEFLVNVNDNQNKIVDTLFEMLTDKYPDNEIDVMATHVFITEDTIEGSGYDDTNYGRSTG